MRWLINYIRQCFCKHEFGYTEVPYEKKYFGEFFDEVITTRKNIRVSMICKKCTYHKKFDKF
jgi:hypothetical protein